MILVEPRARVRHRVALLLERTGWRYFRSRCYAEGLWKAAVSDHAGSRDGLATERAYALRTLPRGVLRGVVDTLTLHDIAGVVRGLAITAGLVLSATGYLVGTLSKRAELGRE